MGDEDEMLDRELLARLAAANPVDLADVPGPDSPQARALFQEITMEAPTARPSTRVWGRPALVASVAAGLAAVTLGIVALVGTDPTAEPGPIATGGPPASEAPPPMLGMCAELYSLETLPDRDFAFDGTLTAIDGERATFDVHEVFKGDLAATITLEGASSIASAGMTSVDSAGLAIGDRALVSGSDGFAWGCGFTMPWDEATASSWRDALG